MFDKRRVRYLAFYIIAIKIPNKKENNRDIPDRIKQAITQFFLVLLLLSIAQIIINTRLTRGMHSNSIHPIHDPILGTSEKVVSVEVFTGAAGLAVVFAVKNAAEIRPKPITQSIDRIKSAASNSYHSL